MHGDGLRGSAGDEDLLGEERAPLGISDDDCMAPWGDGDTLCVARDSVGANGHDPHSGDIVD